MDNLILVGCGNRGLHHLDAMQKFGTVPRMFCDFNETSLTQLKNKHKSSMFFNDLNDLTKKIENNLSHFAIVSVDVVNNNKVALKLLESGVNVLVEKPPGLEIEDVQLLHEASIKNKVFCYVGFDRRFNPFVTKALEIIKQEGDIFNVSGEFNKDISEWIGKRGFDDNILDKMVLESPIHSIDLINFITSSKLMKVSGFSRRFQSKYRTSFTAMMEYENGSVGSINSSYISSGRMERYVIHGRNISIYLDGINSGKIFYKSKTYDLKIEQNLSSTEIQMKNFLDFISNKEKYFKGATIGDSLNIYKITNKMFENTYNET